SDKEKINLIAKLKQNDKDTVARVAKLEQKQSQDDEKSNFIVKLDDDTRENN
ncbi:6689_t:CDS:1, partial [Diversispora eburnea]